MASHDAPDYCAFYCEENVWRLARRLHRRAPRARSFVVLITNAAGRVAVFAQRTAPGPADPVIWDYHVVLFVSVPDDPDAWVVWDLDSSLGAPVDAATWISRSFRPFDAALSPSFRVIDGPTYVTELRSDRSHMRTADGRWQAPPPPWPAPGSGGSNLACWRDPTDAAAPGTVLDLAGLRARFAPR